FGARQTPQVPRILTKEIEDCAQQVHAQIFNRLGLLGRALCLELPQPLFIRSLPHPHLTHYASSLTGSSTMPAPDDARTGATQGSIPVRSWYASATLLTNDSTASSLTRLTVAPPQPAPVRREPRQPGCARAISTMMSSSGELAS